MNRRFLPIYEDVFKRGSEIIEEITQQPRTKYPILLIRGIPNVGKTTFMNELCRRNRIRLNLHTNLPHQKTSISQELMDDTVARKDVLSMFERKPRLIFYGFRHMERIITYEKTTYRSLIQYLKTITPETCKPIILVLTEPMSEQKYQDMMNYVGYTIELNGICKEWMVQYLLDTYHIPSQVATTYANYVKHDFRRFRQVIREIEAKHTTPHKNVFFQQATEPTFLEVNERNTMKQRLQLYLQSIGGNIPEQIQLWSMMLQETELATMGQTIHESIFEHFGSFEEYEKYLATFIESNKYQLLQHLYNRHAIEPYWIYGMIHMPFQLARPHKSSVKFTKLLTRSSIQSNYKKFIEGITQTQPLYEYMNEFDTCENPVQLWTNRGMPVGDARRLQRSFQRMIDGGIRGK